MTPPDAPTIAPLTAWLRSHHMWYAVVNMTHGPRWLAVAHRVSASCIAHHMIGAVAVYHAHTVLYCYTNVH